MAERALEQSIFTWVGADRRGTRLSGETRGASIAVVKADLRRQGINPIKVSKKSIFALRNRRRIGAKDIAVFARQIATMMTAGVPIVQAFEIISRGHDNVAMSELVQTIKLDVEGGSSLSEALAKHPLYFDDLFCHLVRAGEHAGILEVVLQKVATYKERIEAIKGKIKKAMFYPAVIVVVAFIVTAVMLIYVVPEFENLFKSFGGDLPAFTRGVIGMSRFMQSWWWAILLVVIVGIYFFIQSYKRSRKLRQGLDRLALKLPILGSIFTKAAIARFSRTLSTMFGAGVPLVESMASVAGATGNIIYSDAVLEMREAIATGQQLHVAMGSTKLFPHMVNQMVAIGEESGALDEMLGKVAEYYEQEVDNQIDALTSLLEPIIIVVIGTLVGGLVVAMYLPIFKLGAVI